MGDGVFNIARGKIRYYLELPAASDSLLVVLLQTTGLQADDTLRDHDTLAVLLAASNDEATFTNYCVGMETECLTRRAGWTRYDQLCPGDEILAYDHGTNTTRWERPSEVYVHPDYSGSMITLTSRGFSARTTPDHRWPVIHMSGSWPNLSPQSHTLTTENLPSGPGERWKLLRHAPFEGPETPAYSDAFVRIVAWYFTEGCLIRGGKSIAISQSDSYNPVHVEDIRRDIKSIGAQVRPRPSVCSRDGCGGNVRSDGMCLNHYQSDHRARKRRGETFLPGKHRANGLYVTERMRQRDRMVSWDLYGTTVDAIIACCPGKNKVPTMEFLSALTAGQAKMFVEVCIAADGSPEWNRFEQHNDDRMAAFTVAAVLAGHGPTVSTAGTTCHLHSYSPYVSLNNVRREKDEFTGVIWCPVLPSGFWVARRNGKVHITGNSRKIISTAPTLAVNDTLNRLDADTADITWVDAGGVGLTNNNLSKMLVCYFPASGSADTAVIPLTYHDFLFDPLLGTPVTTDGDDMVAVIALDGFYRSS